jgi:hypothetical protein
MKNGVAVGVRIRPQSKGEAESNSKGNAEVLYAEGGDYEVATTVWVNSHTCDDDQGIHSTSARHTRSNETQRRFTFDYVFGKDATQEIIFDRLGQSVLSSAQAGFNATIFAYGQTGTLFKHIYIKSE